VAHPNEHEQRQEAGPSADGPGPKGRRPPTPEEAAARRRSVRRTTLVLVLIVSAFYFGFIILTLVRGSS